LVPPHDFAATFARFSPPIHAKCRRMLGRSAAAEDVVQETFARLWKSGVAEGSDTRTVMAWLYRTCTRLAIDVIRERKRSVHEAVDYEAVPCGVDLAASAAARAAIESVAAQVPHEELEVAVLCRIDGLSQPDAAMVLAISERTVRRMLDRFDARTEPLRKEFTS
jgi:RNA polymerase sigma-70 factor, ECF subfamily